MEWRKTMPKTPLEKQLEKQMRQAAKEFDFERAAELRDIILEIKGNL